MEFYPDHQAPPAPSAVRRRALPQRSSAPRAQQELDPPRPGSQLLSSRRCDGGARRGKPMARPWGGGARRADLASRASGARRPVHPPYQKELTEETVWGGSAPPNGSRLSCGCNARGRKAMEPQIKRLAGEATQFFLTCERPASFKRLLGSSILGLKSEHEQCGACCVVRVFC